jgi:hypothetical protein
MKKWLFILPLFIFTAGVLYAQTDDKQPSRQSVAAQRKAFKAQRKQLDKLVKQYKKASEQEKPAIKAQLEKAVGERVDMGLDYLKTRIDEEKANIQRWEDKLKADEARLPQLKEERLNDLLSGEAKKKFKEARKKWKKQLKDAAKR